MVGLNRESPCCFSCSYGSGSIFKTLKTFQVKHQFGGNRSRFSNFLVIANCMLV